MKRGIVPGRSRGRQNSSVVKTAVIYQYGHRLLTTPP